MEIKNYIKKHQIIAIGEIFGEYVCTDTIVDNPEKFIEIVLKNNCYISEITWWDKTKIISGSQIGYGGPRDPQLPNEYFYAETDIFKTFEMNTTEKEYKEYLYNTKSYFSKYNLFPAFDVKPI